jgi:hypothetical protein
MDRDSTELLGGKPLQVIARVVVRIQLLSVLEESVAFVLSI